MSKDNKDYFVSYDYKEIEDIGKKTAMLKNCYESLGWEIEREDNKKIIFRRNRKIINKMELTRLERCMEATFEEIDNLQKSKTRKASVISIALGLVGTVFMAGSVFAVTANPPIIWLCILLAIPGFSFWVLAPIIYPKIVSKRTKEINDIIEQKYDEIYAICAKGNSIL